VIGKKNSRNKNPQEKESPKRLPASLAEVGGKIMNNLTDVEIIIM